MPPITIIFVITGLAVWLIAFYFLDIGAKPAPGGADPAVTVGVAATVAGLVDLVEAIYIMTAGGLASDGTIVLAGLVTFYGLFFTVVGWSLARGLDLRPVANLAIAVAIVPLFWWKFFEGGWMFRSILVLWVITFLAVAATVYGKMQPKLLGGILLITSLYAFLLPPVILALGHAIP